MSAPRPDNNNIPSNRPSPSAPDALERALAAAFSELAGAESTLEPEADADTRVPSEPSFSVPAVSAIPAILAVSLPSVPLPYTRPAKVSGWLVGIAVGVLIGLWMIPPVRYTLGSQLRFAFSQDSLPWVRTLDTQPSLNEVARLDVAAATLPDDYLLQVGRATAFVEAGGVRAAPVITVGHADDARDLSDHTLVRLTRVAHDFPIAPGAQAHLARYMMVDRVRIQRAELAPGRQATAQEKKEKKKKSKEEESQSTIGNPERLNTPTPERLTPISLPARYTDVKLTIWALTNGERVDPDNAFWPAMMAATYFAAGRDTQALAALARCERKTRWDSYLYEEILGQWRLYSQAYGDHGAAQKIGPLSLIAFPHLRELRHTAEMARWYADQAAAKGDINRAVQIRRQLLQLGHILRETATWAYEALYGTDLSLIAATDSDSTPQQSAIRTMSQWEKQAQRYLALLRQASKKSEITVLYTEVEESCKLRERVDLARADATYPGIPPGIPLVELFGDWMTGVCLLQQLLLLSLCFGAAAAIRLGLRRGLRISRMARILSVWIVFSVTLGSGILLFSSLPSSRLAILFFAGVCALVALSAVAWQRFGARKPAPTAVSFPSESGLIGSSPIEKEERLFEGSVFARQQAQVEQRWSSGTTLRLLCVLFAPGAVALWFLRPLLSSLHPVALLLTSLMGGETLPSGPRALEVALLACALPLTLVILLCLWALRRRVSVYAAIVVGLRRVYLPAVACLALIYLLLLHQTLLLDADATHAINEAARDDLHWVLTHSEEK